MVDRRRFLLATGAMLSSITLPPSVIASGGIDQRLRAEAFGHALRPGRKTEVWGYNASMPGPMLRARRGAQVRVALDNALPQPTTIHWHGVRVPNAMDGVPYVTQAPVDQGAQFTYAFTLPDSGTYWYHPHQNSFEQVPRGLYGGFVVEEDRPPAADREIVWLVSDFKLDEDNAQVDDFGRLRDIANDGRIGNVVALNGRAAGGGERIDVRAGERLRVRVVNTSSARVFSLAIEGHEPRVIAYDGQAVDPHAPPEGRIVVGPGMRADLILDCAGSPGSKHTVTDAWYRRDTLATLAYRDEAPLRGGAAGAPLALEPNALQEPDLAKATHHFLLFEGGMRGVPILGMVDGKPTGIFDMMQKHSLAWTMNYTAAHEHAMMHVPLLRLRRGEHTLLKMINETDYWHPMHLHGHFFRVVTVGGKPYPRREWRDTAMIGPRQSVEIAFVADNPGEWMFHCHILEHAAGGMMGTITVE